MATLKVIDQPSAEPDSRVTSAPIISMVQNALATETRDVSAEAIINAIRRGNWQKPIERIRRVFDDTLKKTGDRRAARKAVEADKKKLPAVLGSGRFSRRAKDALVQHSGLLWADLDELGEKLPDIRSALLKSPYLWALFRSPTGDGLKAGFRVPADGSKHPESFRAIERHVIELTGIQIDQSGTDVSRMCFVSYDPDCYLNPNAKEIEPLPEPEKPKLRGHSANRDAKPDKEQIRKMLAVIPKRPDYHGWIKVVAAVGDALPDHDAIEVLNDWSEEEWPGEYAEKLRHRLSDVHIGTLIHLAREHGWRGDTTPRVDLWSKGESVEHGYAGKIAQTDEATFARLAALPVLEYERCREAEAEKLGCRVSVLDRQVEARRPKNRESNVLQGNAVQLPDVEPWPEPVNGAELLNEIAEAFKRYVVLPDVAACVCALWCAHTHVFYLFLCSPRLNVRSAEPECGKTTLRDVVGLFVPRPVLTENLTVAVLFRLVNAQKPVILADEYDAWMRENEEMRGLLNAGHRRGAMVYRCEGDGNEVRAFDAYAPAMLCGIGALPGTLHDRSIVIHLERAKSDELKAYFDSQKTQREAELCRKLARWCDDNRERLATANPELPHGVFNRLADNWRLLFTIAKVAGGDWPKRCADACAKLTGRDYEDAESIRTLLLVDIRKILIGEWPLLAEGEEPIPIERIFSKTLAEQLCEMAERPWPEARRGKPISEQWLAKQLANFRIHPKTLRIG